MRLDGVRSPPEFVALGTLGRNHERETLATTQLDTVQHEMPKTNRQDLTLDREAMGKA